MLINNNLQINKLLKKTKTKITKINTKQIIFFNLIFWDMMYCIKIWRQIHGYSSNGQRSHSNNKSNKKNKKILLFRVQQFYKLFGKKKRDIFPTLIIAEYNNRLWFTMWFMHWLEGKVFIFKLALRTRGKVKFDPHMLSKNIVTGVKKKKKKKHNASKKKIALVATIGLPILFSLHLYGINKDKNLPYKLNIPDDSRRKMGKKKKKKK